MFRLLHYRTPCQAMECLRDGRFLAAYVPEKVWPFPNYLLFSDKCPIYIRPQQPNIIFYFTAIFFSKNEHLFVSKDIFLFQITPIIGTFCKKRLILTMSYAISIIKNDYIIKLAVYFHYRFSVVIYTSFKL